MDFNLGTFVCDQCTLSPGAPHEVVLNEDAESVRGKNDRMERFNRQTQFIQDGLRKSEAMMLPAFDAGVWIKNNIQEDKQKQWNGNGLKTAGSEGKREDEGIGVLLSVDKDELTRRREREEEAQAKRQQNIMPSWHLKSTISNDLTALGVAAATQQTNEHTTGLPSLSNGHSNSSILNGLGKPKPEPEAPKSQVSVVQDIKPAVDPNADCKSP